MSDKPKTLNPWVLGIAGLVVLAVVVMLLQTREDIDALIIHNGAEVQSLDPSIMRGVPEHRVALAIFEGLCGYDPKTLEPVPGVAEKWDVSPDGKTYTFHLRATTWSNGDPVTAGDFVYAWKRILKPETAADYAHMVAHHVKGGRAYHEWALAEGALQMFEGARVEEKNRKKTLSDLRGACGDQVARLAKIQPLNDAERATLAEFADAARSRPTPSLDDIGIRAIDDRTFELTMEHVAPYILTLQGHYAFFPLPRKVVEAHGDQWTRPENIACNGPYRVRAHEVGSHLLLEKNPTYWDAANVPEGFVKFLPVEESGTAFRMYEDNQIHWITDVPRDFVKTLMKRPDYFSDTFYASYYYAFDVTKPALNKREVRLALSYAVDRQAIVENITQSGEQAAGTLVPPGVPGYPAPEGHRFDPEEARRLLAAAGYPGGAGFPKIDIVYNTLESHKKIAAAIQQMWKEHLHIEVDLKNQEWGTYLDTMSRIDFQVIRRGWVGDYMDPNTFLELMVTGGGNNNTNWGNKEYDRLILEAAASEPDSQKRFELMAKAEKIMLDEAPILPLYFYVSHNMVKPEVQGFHDTLLDVHPLHRILRASGNAP